MADEVKNITFWAIGDLHLSIGLEKEKQKPMDQFGAHWVQHTAKIAHAWCDQVKQDDVDTSMDEITLLKNKVAFLDDEIAAFKETVAAGFDAKMNASKKDDVVVDDVEVSVEESQK